MTILTLTTVVTSLQFVFPEIIPALNRDWNAMQSGEWWRLITPIFIQPLGVWQCFFNALFFISFVPLAEHLYGKRVLLFYFGISMIGQLIIIYWETTPGGLPTAGGGSSSALYAVMGSLFMYVLLNYKVLPKGYLLIPLAGFSGALILIFFEDGHAPCVILGGIIAFLVRDRVKPEKEMKPIPIIET